MTMVRNLVFLSLVAFTLRAEAGVDYYSGTGSSVTFTYGSGSTTPWMPIQGSSTNAVSQTGSGTVSLDGSRATNTVALDIYMSSGVFFGNDWLEGTPNGSKFTVNSAGTEYNSVGTGPSYNAKSLVRISDGTDTAIGWSPTTPRFEHFLWHAEDSSSNLVALGWAKFEYDPGSPGSNPTDEFTILEWAYNLAGTAGDATIITGDTSINNNQVPEPTGLAIFALASLGLASARRRRS